jgi:hypothetical protein
MKPLERKLFGFFSALWLLDVLLVVGFVRLPDGAYTLSLYAYYGVAAILGWVAGNVWVARRRGLRKHLSAAAARQAGRHLLVVYLLGPPSVLYLLRALAPHEVRAAAPLVPLWAFCVYGVFFLVPVTLAPKGRPKGR